VSASFPWRQTLRDAALVVVASVVMAVTLNGLRAQGIPWIRTEPFETLVPCPEPAGDVGVVRPVDLLASDPTLLLVDARAASSFAGWHLPGAVHLPFDYLEPLSDAQVREVVRRGAARVVVYGDGEDPDTGRELARLLAGRGVRNVSYVEGGAPALQAGERP
jgi:hypothetical protein